MYYFNPTKFINRPFNKSTKLSSPHKDCNFNLKKLIKMKQLP